jgi:ArsR family transcriptional regulator, nickel/cobalt-responsive transcriptional repressor
MKRYSCVHAWYHVRMGHSSADRDAPPAQLTPASAAQVAATLQALATPSRLLILAALRREPCTVTRLAEQAGMEQSAVSHQLRLLRNLGLVAATRQGKNMIYELFDDHVAQLLDQAVYHSEHLRLGLRDAPAEAESAIRAY